MKEHLIKSQRRSPPYPLDFSTVHTFSGVYPISLNSPAKGCGDPKPLDSWGAL